MQTVDRRDPCVELGERAGRPGEGDPVFQTSPDSVLEAREAKGGEGSSALRIRAKQNGDAVIKTPTRVLRLLHFRSYVYH